MKSWVQTSILVLGFLLGVALMGVEMVAIRMMTPYFGSGIDTWSCMIATVMMSLMAGYYIGGMVADRAPRSDVLGAAVIASGIYLLGVPLAVTPFLDWMLENVGYDATATIASAVALMFIPLTLLSFFSPFAVRLLLMDTEHGGRVAGSVYSITTIGNVVGTLGTSLFLMRFMGAQAIMYMFAGLIIVCGVGLVLLRKHAVKADAA